jgi:hypothetical protein
MKTDVYLRAVLTVIAAALVYLCVILTPLPTASAQGQRVVGAPTPGVSTGPAEMVVVGWRVPEIPVTIANEVRVSGRVETTPASLTAQRTVLVGWEERARVGQMGTLRPLDPDGDAIPVSVKPIKP